MTTPTNIPGRLVLGANLDSFPVGLPAGVPPRGDGPAASVESLGIVRRRRRACGQVLLFLWAEPPACRHDAGSSHLAGKVAQMLARPEISDVLMVDAISGIAPGESGDAEASEMEFAPARLLRQRDEPLENTLPTFLPGVSLVVPSAGNLRSWLGERGNLVRTLDALRRRYGWTLIDAVCTEPARWTDLAARADSVYLVLQQAVTTASVAEQTLGGLRRAALRIDCCLFVESQQLCRSA